MTIDVEPGTIAVYSDIACPWATIAMHRLVRARERVGLAGQVAIEPRAFPLEVVNRRPTPKRVLDDEVAVLASVEPELEWRGWRAEPATFPVTTLLAMEAVEAAKAQSLAASEALDVALRRALFTDSRCISVPSEILDVAQSTPGVDADAISAALDDARARAAMLQHHQLAGEQLKGSPHLFLADGSDAHNPGFRFHVDESGGGHRPVIEHDDPSVYDDLVRRAATAAA